MGNWTAHSYITRPEHGLQVEQVLRQAELARENSGNAQWVHHHPEGHLCNHLCGPIEGQRRGARG